jgi:hypothetical protein
MQSRSRAHDRGDSRGWKLLVRRHRLKNRTAMRISVSNWSTTDEDVDKSLVAILRAAAKCAR